MNTADHIDRAVVGITQHSADATHPPLSEHLPPFDAIELALAACFHDIAAIDAITDKLVADGLARPRDDVSMLDQLRASARARFGGRA